MKRSSVLFLTTLLAVTLAFFPGCGERDAATPPAETTPQQLAPEPTEPVTEPPAVTEYPPTTFDDVQRETSEAARTVWDYAKGKSEDFRAAMSDEMSEIDARMEQLRQQAAKLSGEAREQMEKKLADLQEKRQAFSEQVNRASANSGEAWEEVKEGVRGAYDEVSEALGRAYAELQGEPERVAPPPQPDAGLDDTAGQGPPPSPVEESALTPEG